MCSSDLEVGEFDFYKFIIKLMSNFYISSWYNSFHSKIDESELGLCLK